jgi:serine protease inhibitor
MKNLFLITLSGILLLFTQCTSEPAVNLPTELDFDCADNAAVCTLTNDNNQFGFDIFRKLHEEEPDDNIFISPLSISTALSMTLNGAKGQTFADMKNAMQIPDWDIAQLNEAYKLLLEVLPQLDNDVKMELANSIWYRTGFNVRQDFLDVNSSYYGSQVQDLDFSNPTAKDIINAWVNENTHGKIESIVDQIGGDVVMYLINAIYFKGAWLHEFDPDNTSEQPFYLADGSQVMVDMMSYGQTTLPFFQTENFMAADLAYGDSIFSMSIFLPKGNYPIGELVNDLESADWNTWVQNFEDTEMFFSMPKFKMEYEKKLNRPLSDLGMSVAFTDFADFSGINGTGGLRIDEVRHKSFVEVNEEGTEAAAVTSVVIVETSVPLIPDFRADKPFLFVIRDKKTNSVLFIGKMMNPVE